MLKFIDPITIDPNKPFPEPSVPWVVGSLTLRPASICHSFWDLRLTVWDPGDAWEIQKIWKLIYLVVSTHLKNISQIVNAPHNRGEN